MSRLLLTLAVDNALDGKAIGIKEAIAMDLEKYGDVKVLRVEAQEPEQIGLCFDKRRKGGSPNR